MKVQTFMGKASSEGLHQMDAHINEWLTKHQVTLVHICQSFGLNRHHDGRTDEPVVIISVWYEEAQTA